MNLRELANNAVELDKQISAAKLNAFRVHNMDIAIHDVEDLPDGSDKDNLLHLREQRAENTRQRISAGVQIGSVFANKGNN